MGSYPWVEHEFLIELEERGFVTNTFIRLDEERRGQVIDAVLAESARSGPERLNIKEVAHLASVPVGSLYQYFGDRESLARFAALVLARKLSGELNTAIPYIEAMSLREALASYLSYGIEWSMSEAASLRSFVVAVYAGAPRGSTFSEDRTEEDAKGDDWYIESLIRPVAAAMQELVRRAFTAAEARGELRSGVDVEAAVRLSNVLLIAVGDARMMSRLDEYYRLYGPGTAAESRIAEAVDFICRAVAREGAAT